MRIAASRASVLSLAVLLSAAAPGAQRVAYVDLARLVANHPLHAVLLQYDREIAALQSTRNLTGLRDAGARTEHSIGALQRDASGARLQVEEIASRGAAGDGAREREALEGIAASQRAGDAGMTAYTAALTRETNANLANYRSAIAARTARAFDARVQQLREKELTLAFDLARANGGERLMLQVKLADLHLTHAARAKLRAALAALDASELKAVATLRRTDEAILGAYRGQLQREAAVAAAAMGAQFRAKADANLAIRRRVLQAGASASAGLPRLPSQLEAFRASYRSGSDAASIVAGLQTASSDLSARFRDLGASDRQSQRETIAQIERLKATRAELYRSIVAQIAREANRLARERHLESADFVARSRGSIDLTGAVAANLAGF